MYEESFGECEGGFCAASPEEIAMLSAAESSRSRAATLANFRMYSPDLKLALVGNNLINDSNPSTAVSKGFSLPNDCLVDQVLQTVVEAVYPTDRKFNQVFDPSGLWLISSKSTITTHLPPTIPLHISLDPSLTDPTELAFAEAVAKRLSSEYGRTVLVADLEGLVLYLWSEDDPDKIALDEYFRAQSRPLQGLLLQARNLEGQPEPLARAELLPFVGKRFEILAREGQRGSAEVAK